MASNAENVSIWWRHHDLTKPPLYIVKERMINDILLFYGDVITYSYPTPNAAVANLY